jgi:hypothetical protein
LARSFTVFFYQPSYLLLDALVKAAENKTLISVLQKQSARWSRGCSVSMMTGYKPDNLGLISVTYRAELLAVSLSKQSIPDRGRDNSLSHQLQTVLGLTHN